MEICDLLSTESIVSIVRASSKKHALQELAAHAAKISGQNDRAIFDILLERERLGTTGMAWGCHPARETPRADPLIRRVRQIRTTDRFRLGRRSSRRYGFSIAGAGECGR